MVNKVRKQISFDLSTHKLEQYYPCPKDSIDKQFYKKAYKDIREFMKSQGFEHRQGSVYVSIKPQTIPMIEKLLEQFDQKFEWAYLVINKMDITNVSEVYSLKKKFQNIHEKANSKIEDNENQATKFDDKYADNVKDVAQKLEREQMYASYQEFDQDLDLEP